MTVDAIDTLTIEALLSSVKRLAATLDRTDHALGD
jgi:hypothetical protein